MSALPAKDQAVFRSIVKFYETKQYKKGVKAADTILKKHPEHGETLCMKGLSLSYLDKKEEAYELVRKGLKHDLRSHVCWHVYGLLYRADKDYLEAVKCYRQALKIDPENMQILRDLSLLQIHIKDLSGFAETRRKLLQLKPSNRINWVGYAVAEHLCKNHEFAWTCCENYEKTFKEDSEDTSPYETSELLMYKVSIMEEAGRFEEALEALKQHEKSIVDKLGMMELKGRLCIFLKRFDEAKEIFRKLISINPEHHIYLLSYMASHVEFHRFWPALPAPEVAEKKDGDDKPAQSLPSTMCSFPNAMHPEGIPILGWLPPQHALKPHNRVAVGKRQHKRRIETYEPAVPLTPEEEDAVTSWFDGLLDKHPKSDSMQKLILHFLSGDRFQKRLDAYLRTRLRKGIPSLFRMLRPYYFQPGKPEILENVLIGYLTHLEAEVPKFAPAGDEEPPTSLLFTLMLLAYHFDFTGEPTRAMGYVDRALEHTPTLVELYACKGRIYRHNGLLEESAKWFDEVREMDLADRYLNTQCVKALLRNDKTQEGMEKALMFSREPDSAGAANLHDMQCMWFESAMGRSFRRQNNLGKALKQLNETFKHFADICEDKFDFHNYCLRKSTLKTYVGMLKMQERLYSHKFFRRAAKDAISIYLHIYDKKQSGEWVNGADKDGDGKEGEMSAADKKKAKHAKARAAKKAEAEKVETKTDAKPGSKPKKVDDDPNGEKLLEKDPMEEATKLAKTLVLNCASDLQTHVLTYDIFSRQGKVLHCLQAIVKLWRLSGCDKLHYKLISCLAHFCFVLDLDKDGTSAVVKEVVLSEIAPVFGSDQPYKSVADVRKAANGMVDLVEDRMKTNKALPVIEVLYSLKCLKHAGRETKAFLEGYSPEGAFALKDCNKLLAYIASEHGKDAATYKNFEKKCQDFFPLMAKA